MTLRITIVNPVWASFLASADMLLDTYHTLTGWADAVAATGGAVTVVQRWMRPEQRERNGVTYRFIAAGGAPTSGRCAASVLRAITDSAPDIVHLNGVLTPAWVRAIRSVVGSAVRIVVQDHGGWHPGDASTWARWRVRGGLARADAVLVASSGQASVWRRRHVVPPRVPVFDVMEGSTDFSPQPRAWARRASRLAGAPAVLHVGRLTEGKDPLTVLDGFARCVPEWPDAHLTFVGPGGALEPVVRQRCATDPVLRSRTTITGAVRYADLEAFYSAADIFVSGSRREGSGYAALEAMACGAIPVLSDIAPFDGMTDRGRVGERWTAGDARACGAAMARAAARGDDDRQIVRARFVEALSWPAIGVRAREIYREVCAR